MGASYNSMTIPGDKTRAEVKVIFAKVQDDDRYENGHSYSGGFGMARGLTFRDKTFERERDADEWLTENCQKWGDALAVTFKDVAGKTQWMIGAWCSS